MVGTPKQVVACSFPPSSFPVFTDRKALNKNVFCWVACVHIKGTSISWRQADIENIARCSRLSEDAYFGQDFL